MWKNAELADERKKDWQKKAPKDGTFGAFGV